MLDRNNVSHIYFSCGIVQNEVLILKLRLQTHNKHLINQKPQLNKYAVSKSLWLFKIK